MKHCMMRSSSGLFWGGFKKCQDEWSVWFPYWNLAACTRKKNKYGKSVSAKSWWRWWWWWWRWGRWWSWWWMMKTCGVRWSWWSSWWCFYIFDGAMIMVMLFMNMKWKMMNSYDINCEAVVMNMFKEIMLFFCVESLEGSSNTFLPASLLAGSSISRGQWQ